jgi:endonuclease YncB( thermonuclease family)
MRTKNVTLKTTLACFFFLLLCVNFGLCTAQPRFSTRCTKQFTLIDTVETRVESIVDGDTFRVRTQVLDSVRYEILDSLGQSLRVTYKPVNRDTSVSIRIIGIDTFESRLIEKLYKQAREANITPTQAMERGLRAKEFATRTLLNRDIILCRDLRTPRQDLYCRPLYRVWILGVDGQMVEYAELVRRAGLTDPNSRWNEKPLER